MRFLGNTTDVNIFLYTRHDMHKDDQRVYSSYST